jgi:inosine/xanthosine triphosphate pyrophosphatase family protein
MQFLSDVLKHMLNGLAMQYQADYLSDEDKQANLQKVLAQIEQERQAELVQNPSNAQQVTFKPAVFKT